MRRPVLSITLALVGCTLFAFAIASVFSAERSKGAFRDECDRELASVACDLTQPGTYHLKVATEYRHGHGFLVLLDASGFEHEPVKPSAGGRGGGGSRGVLAVPAGAVRLPDLAGTVVSRVESSGSAEKFTVEVNRDWCWEEGGRVLLARVQGDSYGRHALDIEITTPVSAAIPGPQRLVVKNSLCGCELMVLWFLYPVAAVSGLVGAALGYAAYRCARVGSR